MEYFHKSVEGKWKFIINSKGFRNTGNIRYKKPKDCLRIISIGDSHTLGYEVAQEETFSWQLEHELLNISLKAQVINAGVSGFGTSEELAFLENAGLKYDPDFVILGFFKNDYDDNIRSNLFTLKNDSLITNSKTYTPGIKIQDIIYRFSLIRWLSENSYLYSFVFNKIWDFYKNSSIENAQTDIKEYAINLNQTVDGYKKDLASKLLARFYQTCKLHDIKLIIIDLPSWELNNTIGSSMRELLNNSKEPLCDYLIKFEDILGNLDTNQIVRLKGHHHISEKTHRNIAKLCFNYILENVKK